ncbi:nickel pincer cofactor biosynthesis protein LarC [Bariatricus sp. SGI.154]|uniref:nickel pincer cofactor biosynthesis protein LarC n=1 Tax=Bariatricus sp. SGI.154 TaxID=3420549 RepID=UPI003CFD23AD
MSNTLYLECYSGISGDMTVGVLLDLGADPEVLKEQLRSLPINGFEIQISRVKKSGLDACDFNVILDKEHENHDHDNEYLYGHDDMHEHSHDTEQHTHMHEHSHEGSRHTHEHTHGGNWHTHEHFHGESGQAHHIYSHEHRGLREIQNIIRDSGISDRAKQIASNIFLVLGQAEAKAHGTTLEEVHFHEVGAVDSIVDIVAAAICLDNLDITGVVVPELYEGRGTIRCQHGIIPVPVPAVANIAERHGLALHITDTEAELVTPTGAAIVAAVRTSDRLPGKYRILKTGMGAGKRDYGRTSILRGMLIQPVEDEADYIYKLESNIDDCTGEAFGYVMEQLFAAGARDVHYVPVYMKKNRPAYQLNVICSEEDVSKMEEIIFRETTTIGIRRVKMERTVMKREIHTMTTSFGEARIKICKFDGNIRVYPEYESVAAICRNQNLSYQDVWSQIRHEAENVWKREFRE